MRTKRKDLLRLYCLDFDSYIKELKNEDPGFFSREGFRTALKTFRQAAERVPAYKDFLRKNKINPKNIKTFEDFKSLPITNKEYLRSYKLNEICWDGNLHNLDMISTSSGSTGEPFYWPRGVNQEEEVTKLYELVYRTYDADKKRTLLVIGYSMGNWVAGTFTLTATMRLAQKGYPITIISPGIIVEEMVKAVKNLSGNFEQIILAGYPPFIKDVIDHGKNGGINWGKLNVKFIFGGEVISEQWRDYILKAVGKTREVERLTNTMNTYGSADAGILGFETPVSIYLRRNATKNRKLHLDLFEESNRIPTLAQYDPRFKFFEVNNNKLIFTSSSGIPLIRYDIGDDGSIISYEAFIALCGKYGINLEKDFRKMGISDLSWKLPFVYLFGRKDLTATLYGLNVYPENIKAALESQELSKYVTGKFTMSTEETARHNQFLLINIELAQKVKNGDHLHREVTKIIVEKLKELNSEYSKLYSSIGKKATPKINLIKNGDPKYFKIKIKQRWVHKK
jgi:phenylacetate-CoA ligase